MEENNRTSRFYFAIILTLLLCVFLYFSRRVLTPFFIAFALAYCLDPLVDRMENLKISRTVSVLVLMALFFTFCIGAVLLVFPLLQAQAQSLASRLPEYVRVIQEWVQPLLIKVEGLDQAQIQDILNKTFARFGEIPVKIVTFLSGFIWDSFSNLFNIFLALANLVLIPVVMFYLLRDFDRINQKILDLVPPRLQKETKETFEQIDRVLASFVRGQLMVALLMGILYSIGLFFIGTPMSLFIGLMAGLANLVPYLGIVVGFVPAALLTYLQTQEWLPVLGVAGVFAVVQMLEGMVITPRVLGSNIGLHPVAVIFAVLLGGELFGLTGIILGVPAVAVINVLLHRGVLKYKQSSLYSS